MLAPRVILAYLIGSLPSTTRLVGFTLVPWQSASLRPVAHFPRRPGFFRFERDWSVQKSTELEHHGFH